MASPAPILRGPAAAKWFVKFFRDPVATLIEGRQRFGRVFGLGGVFPRRKRHRLFGVALGPAYNRIVYNDTAIFRATGQALCGPKDSALRRIRFGLTRMNGDKHKQHRRLIAPLFSNHAVDEYHPHMAAIAARHIMAWPVGQVVDAWQLVRKLALDVSSQLLFGREEPERANVLGNLFRGWLERNFSPGVWLMPVNMPGTPYRGLLKHSEHIERTVLAMIAQRRTNPPRDADMLTGLIRAHDSENDGGTDHDLVGQANILFAASFETIGTSLAWMMFLLAQHPTVAANLLDELQPLRGLAPRADQLPRLKYLDAVIREALRVLPPVPFAIRRPAAQVDLDGLVLEKGDRLIVSHYITHHDPEIYDEPERFIPERWFRIRPTAFEYLPFSAGPRMCSGFGFAMAELKIVLALALQRWRPTVMPGSQIDRTVKITMGPRHGLPMVFMPQDGLFTSTEVRGNIHDMVDLRPRILPMTVRRAA
ncbi:MAG: cytochrome P450 [Gemmataceae bacterium]